MRVIAGSAKRTVLVAPEGIDTRPTSDRAKESLFNILNEKICGALFLDLFCGSGAIGIEALSRGAEKVFFVDNSNKAKKAVEANLTKTRFLGKSEVIISAVSKAVGSTVIKNISSFDIIFLDPPYGTNLLEETLPLLKSILKKDGLIIAETDVKHEPYINDDFCIKYVKIYGRNKFIFLTHEETL